MKLKQFVNETAKMSWTGYSTRLRNGLPNMAGISLRTSLPPQVLTVICREVFSSMTMVNMLRVVYAGADVAYIEFGTGYVGERTTPYPDEITLNKAIQESGYRGKRSGWYDVNEHGYAGWVYRRKGYRTVSPPPEV